MQIQTTAQRLRQIMASKQISQTELAKLTGLTKSAISQYLSGKFTPKQRALFILSQALDVSVSWLMGFDTPMSAKEGAGKATSLVNSLSLTKHELEHIKKYRLLDKADKAHVEKIISFLLADKKYKDTEKDILSQ